MGQYRHQFFKDAAHFPDCGASVPGSSTRMSQLGCLCRHRFRGKNKWSGSDAVEGKGLRLFWAAGSFAVTAALAAAQPISNSVDAHSRAADVADSDNPVEYQLGSAAVAMDKRRVANARGRKAVVAAANRSGDRFTCAAIYTKTGALLSSAVRTVAAVRRGRAGWPRRMAF